MARTRTRLALAAALVAAALAPLPAGAAPAPRRPALTEWVEVRGPRTGYLPVRIGTPVTVGTAPVAVTGDGAVVAVALVKEPVATMYAGAVIGRFSPTSPAFSFGFGEAVQLGNGKSRLPSGDYRLYLLAGRSPVTTVRFRLAGLAPGTTRLTPRTPTAFLVNAPTPTEMPAPGRFVYMAGSDHAVAGPMLHGGVLLSRHDVHAVTDYGLCGYSGHEPGPPYLYTPGCPSTVTNHGTFATEITVSKNRLEPTATMIKYVSGPFPTGHYGSGGWFAASTPATSAEYVHYFLTL
ncbi:MAG TPA: hypothetical protein VNA20_07075 [Frankiaceae bacterium]|nr:hypothetical protein [Frankiaceae bacterium]